MAKVLGPRADSSFGCAVMALWLFVAVSAAWAFLIGLANSSTQGYAMTADAVLLAFGPGVLAFVFSLFLLSWGLRRRQKKFTFFVLVPAVLIAGVLCAALIINLLRS